MTTPATSTAQTGVRALGDQPTAISDHHRDVDTGQLPIADPGYPTVTSVRMVQTSIAHLVGRERELAKAFHTHLVASVPQLRTIAVDDLIDDLTQFVKTLLTVGASLDAPGAGAQLGVLGSRLEACGVPEGHYKVGARAFVRSVQDLSPGIWSTRLSSAWVGVSSWTFAQMLAGARQARQMSGSWPVVRGQDRAWRQVSTEKEYARAQTWAIAGPQHRWARAGSLVADVVDRWQWPRPDQPRSFPRSWRRLSRLRTSIPLRIVVALVLLGLAVAAATVAYRHSANHPPTGADGDREVPTAVIGPAIPVSPAQSGADLPASPASAPSSPPSPASAPSSPPSPASMQASPPSPASMQARPIHSQARATATVTQYPCQVAYGFSSSWDGGFVVTITYTNTSTTSWSGWSSRFGMSSAATVSNSWGAFLRAQGGYVTVTPADYNASVSAGRTATIGFQGATMAPVTQLGPFSVNGETCRVSS